MHQGIKQHGTSKQRHGQNKNVVNGENKGIVLKSSIQDEVETDRESKKNGLIAFWLL